MVAKKAAFTLIELIFAIVVIAISVMSMPMMSQVTASGMSGALVQEAIFASLAEIRHAATYTWDEESLRDANDINSSSYNNLSRVVAINLADPTDCANSGAVDTAGNAIIRRPGHISRRCLDNLNTPVLGTPTFYAVEAAVHANRNAFTGGGSSQSAYKEQYTSTLSVNYCGNAGACQLNIAALNNDLKEIVVTISNSQNTPVTTLRMYSANIGEVAYASRDL